MAGRGERERERGRDSVWGSSWRGAGGGGGGVNPQVTPTANLDFLCRFVPMNIHAPHM